MKSITKKLALLTLSFILPAGLLWAQDFEPLVGIPGVTDREGKPGIGDYMNAVYRLSISIAALLAVLILIKAGVKYMFSEIVTSKEDAKRDIKGALLGLLLIISAVLILSTINRDLTNFDVVISPIDLSNVVVGSGDGGGVNNFSYQEINRLCTELNRDGGTCSFHACSSITSVEKMGTENDFQACARICEENEGSYSQRNGYARCMINKDTCDITDSSMCCRANGHTWWGDNSVRNLWGALPTSNRFAACQTETQDFEPIRCVETNRSLGEEGSTYDCKEARQICEINRNGTVIATNTAGVLCDTTQPRL